MADTDLQQQIRDLEEQVREKTRILNEKKGAAGDVELTPAAMEQALRDAETQLEAANEELRNAENERAALTPQYERCQRNKAQHAKADEYKREIRDKEKELVEAEATIKDLENKLQEVSKEYKNERERRSILDAKLRTLVDDLRNMVAEKIALTLPVDEAHGIPNARQCLRVLSELTREREMEMAQWSRYKQELAALVQMKKERSVEMELESKRQVSFMRAAKDEEVKNTISQFQEERESLLKDIEAARATNREQLEVLHRTKITPDDKTPTIGSLEAPAKREVATPSEKILAQKTTDLEIEKEQLQEKIKKAAQEKQKMIKALRDLRAQMEADATKFSSALKNLEAQIHKERYETEEIEKQNTNLEEMCDGLALKLRMAGYPAP